ncbi:MAG: exostosin family protein [Rhodospirillales bacterium]|nr:exostosin family protein [Rhodospirillales bacterium]
MSERPFTIVWQRRVLDKVLETAFIRHVLLARVNRPQRWLAIEDGDPFPLMDDMLFVTFDDPVDYFGAVKDHGSNNVGLFQVGDEKGDSGCRAYAMADYVIRNYHFDHQLANKPERVSWVPNGWASGVGPVRATDHLSFAERSLPAFFSGFVGQDQEQIEDRRKMLEIIKENKVQALMATTPGFAQGLGRAAYAAHMGNSRFALVPHGRSPETIRLYDALELGAIPIAVDAPWMHASDGLGVFGKPPFVLLNSWDQLPGHLAGYQGSVPPERLAAAEQLRQSCVVWWQRIKDHYAARVAALING